MTPTSSAGTVLITGGTDGLGKATAVLLAQEGYRVFATGRNAERRAQLEAQARQKNLAIRALEMDVCDDASVDRAVSAVLEEAGEIDALINNAGLGYYVVMEEVRMEDLRQQFETNFFGVVRVTKRVLPGMRQRRRGRIVNISSIAGKFALPLFGPYSGSKFALEGMTDALRLELYPFGIEVVLIEPGYIPTGFQGAARDHSLSYFKNPASPYARVYQSYEQARRSLDRKGVTDTPEDCARVVLRALRDTPPKARYTVTRTAAIASIAKRILSDGMIDRRLRRTFSLRRE